MRTVQTKRECVSPRLFKSSQKQASTASGPGVVRLCYTTGKRKSSKKVEKSGLAPLLERGCPQPQHVGKLEIAATVNSCTPRRERKPDKKTRLESSRVPH